MEILLLAGVFGILICLGRVSERFQEPADPNPRRKDQDEPQDWTDGCV